MALLPPRSVMANGVRSWCILSHADGEGGVSESSVAILLPHRPVFPSSFRVIRVVYEVRLGNALRTSRWR